MHVLQPGIGKVFFAQISTEFIYNNHSNIIVANL